MVETGLARLGVVPPPDRPARRPSALPALAVRPGGTARRRTIAVPGTGALAPVGTGLATPIDGVHVPFVGLVGTVTPGSAAAPRVLGRPEIVSPDATVVAACRATGGALAPLDTVRRPFRPPLEKVETPAPRPETASPAGTSGVVPVRATVVATSPVGRPGGLAVLLAPMGANRAGLVPVAVGALGAVAHALHSSLGPPRATQACRPRKKQTLGEPTQHSLEARR